MQDPGDETKVEGPATASRAPLRPHAGMKVTERVVLQEPLGSGGMADVWSANHLTLGTSVAVKFLRGTHDPVARERFTREAQIAARIDHPHAVRVFDHGETPDGTPFMVMEQIEGEALSDRIRRAGAMPADEVATIVEQISEVLAHAHALDIVHRDIKPHNVMLLAGEKVFVKVLDFGLAKTLHEAEDETLTQAGWVLGTPAYMAPEQLVDAKPATPQSDAWSLAVLVYEALTGQRPFRGHHQAAIGLGMLVQRFDPISSLRPGLPGALDAYFLKAFDVDPTQRFLGVKAQSAALLPLLRGEVGGAPIADGKIRLPNKIYGRDAEVALLQKELAATQERTRLVMLDGYAGVGKTALVEEARRGFSAAGAIFVDGKFDQFNRGTPYDSLLQALRKLVRFVQGRDAHSMAAWRERLGEALSDVALVLTDFIPELEELLGSQALLSETSPAEAKHRMQNAISRFLHAVATPERPLVLFLDDLQWADLPTLEVLAHLVGEVGNQNLLVLGAYRSNEIDASHPLKSTLSALTQQAAPVRDISVGPLGEDAVLEMLSDVLGNVPGRVRLAVLCHEKTQGNPFFLRRFLESLHEDGLLTYDHDAAQWSWESARIQSRSLGRDVVEFVAAEMRRLPKPSCEVLARAACIGGHFDLGTLAHVLELDRKQTLERLRPLLVAHYVLPGSDEVWGAAAGDDVGHQRVTFRFAHDRIHQAARLLLADEEVAKTHHRVATFLLEHLDEHERESRLFELVEHLNRTADMQPALVDDPERLRKLNLSAARRATRAAAFAPANDYYEKARAAFDDSQWETDYATALELHVEGARSAYVSGDHETMRRLVEAAVAHAKSGIDEVKAREVLIEGFIAKQQFAEAVHLGVELLGKLGETLPDDPDTAAVQEAVGATLGEMQALGQEKIVALPLATDEAVLVGQRIRQSVMSAAYLSVPNLLPILTCAIVRSTLKDGVALQSAYGFAVFGMVLNAGMLIDLSYASGQIALALLERSDDRTMVAKTQHIVTTHINPFVEPIGPSVELERRIHQIGMDTGDLEYGAWALHIMVAHGFYAGHPLRALRDTAARHLAMLEQQEQLPALGCTQPFAQAIINCIGESVDDSRRLAGRGYDEDTHMAQLESVGFRGAAYILTVVRCFVRYLFRDTKGALFAADSGGEYADGAISTYHLVWWAQYRALAFLADATPESDLESVRANLAQLEAWLSFSEVNHTHRVALVQAELARVEGRDGDALEHYERAIAHAREHGFTHEEALANELAARFYIGRGSNTPARAYLMEAIDAYADWGAQAKADHLEAELGDILRRRRR